ncbi:hypothetical protein F5Y03DRAFT_115520 [Xylaria venustula]|nr:hypothetical protein F5Y03DRAFT_115520 [Xylaria venustula]
MIPIHELFRDIKSALPSLMSIGIPPATDQKNKTSSEIERVQKKVDFPLHKNTRSKALATISSPAILIWRLPRDISQEELAEILYSTSNWVNAILLSPKQRKIPTAYFAVVTFRNLSGALRISQKLDKYHISCPGKTWDAKVFDSCMMIGHGSLEDTIFSNSRVAAAVTVFGLSRELGASFDSLTSFQPKSKSRSNSFENTVTEYFVHQAKETAVFDDTRIEGHGITFVSCLEAASDFRDLTVHDYHTPDANAPCNTLNIANLPINVSDEKVRLMVAEQRGYKRMCLRTKQTGTMCFVEFENEAFATRALHKLDGRILGDGMNRKIRVTFSKNPLGIRSSSISSIRGTLNGTVSTVGRPASAPGFHATTTLNSVWLAKLRTIPLMDHHPQITQQ